MSVDVRVGPPWVEYFTAKAEQFELQVASLRAEARAALLDPHLPDAERFHAEAFALSLAESYGAMAARMRAGAADAAGEDAS